MSKILISIIIGLVLIGGLVYYFAFWQKGPQLPNPVAVYCEKQDGILESRILEGGSRGFCIFDDGSECGQWDFFWKKCKKGERSCKDLCGDGMCQEIVCMAVGCPCAETPETCPQDCKQGASISSFEECLAKGHPILESYPRQCRTPKGETFVEDIGNELEKLDLIRVSKPRPNEFVQSPLEIKGEARGYWFFEADFPVRLFDENDKELGTGISKTSSEWMTENFVPFQAILEFQTPTTNRGVLILEKDNPSGLPENADELRIPIRFSE